jgi:uncharacterized protein with GYD domain
VTAGRAAARRSKRLAPQPAGASNRCTSRSGGIDAYVVADLPDNVSAAALALAVNQGGGAATSTVVLMTAAEVDEAVKKSVAYRPPGG